MAEITEELRVLVTAEVDKAIKNLNQLDRQTDKTTNGFQTLGKVIAAGALAKGIADFGKASVRAAEDARQKFNLLKTTLSVTGAEAWTSIDAMAQMSKSLSDATNYSVSEIQSMQTVLLGFRSITGDTFREASDAILDMATVMGMDLKSAVQTVGKALDDPVNGIDSLNRQGFAFTETQKSMLKTMVAVGDKAGAQKIILEELATTYGGTAKAAQTSFAKLEHSMDTLKETVGNMVAPVLADLADDAVALLEKFDSLDAGTQRVIVTATALATAAPVVITAIGGVKTALVALGAAAPHLVAIGAGIAAITAVSTKIINSRNAFKDLSAEITKTRTSTNALLDSYAGGNGAKKLDEETTKKLIDLYPQLSGKIDAYSTSVDDAKKAVESLVNKKLIDAETTGISRYLKQLEEVADLELKAAKYKAHNNKIDADAAVMYEQQAEAQKKKVLEQRDAINDRLKLLGKELTYDGKVIDIPIKPSVDKKTVASGLKSGGSDIQKTWHKWLSDILKVDESLFETGKKAADLYLGGLERSLENAEGLSKILGKKFSATDIIDSQLGEIEAKISSLLNIDPPLIDRVFSLDELQQEDSALNELYETWKKLQEKKADSALKDLQKEIDDLSRSDFQRWLETTTDGIDLTAEKVEELKEKFYELKEKGITDLSEKIGSFAETALIEIEGLDAGFAKTLGNMVASASELSFNGALDGFKEFGRALGEGEDAADALSSALGSMALQILDQLPLLFMQAGLQLIAQGQWPLGLGLMAAGLGTAALDGYVNGKIDSAKETNALGGVYGAGDYSAFAKGGTFTNTIVQSPTFFRFAKGSGFGTGLMGEAGPEAIMPLTRGSDGSLGVSASGIGGGNVEVNIPVTVYSDEPVEVNDTTDEDGQRKIEIMVGSMINSHLANGKADKALKLRYGLKAQGV